MSFSISQSITCVFAPLPDRMSVKVRLVLQRFSQYKQDAHIISLDCVRIRHGTKDRNQHHFLVLFHAMQCSPIPQNSHNRAVSPAGRTISPSRRRALEQVKQTPQGSFTQNSYYCVMRDSVVSPLLPGKDAIFCGAADEDYVVLSIDGQSISVFGTHAAASVEDAEATTVLKLPFTADRLWGTPFG